MADEWRTATLADLAEYVNGYPFKPADLGGVGLPVIRIKQLLNPDEATDRHAGVVPTRHHIDTGDLIFSWSGTLASRIWDRGPALLNQHLFKVVERDGVDRRWLGLALDHSIDALSQMTHGTTMRHITKTDLKSFPVAVPPIAEQRRIVDLIGAVDTAYEAARLLERRAYDALASCCVSMTAVSEHERWAPLAEVADVLDSRRVPVSEVVRSRRLGNVPYYGANGQVGWIDEPLFDEPLVLLAEDGGYFDEWQTRTVAYEITGPSWVNNHAHVLRAVGVSHEWLYYSLRHRDLTHIVNVGTRSKLNQKPLRDVPIALVDDAPVRTALLQGLEAVASCASLQADSLASLRHRLLSRLASGVDGVPDSYDRFLDDAA